MPYKSISSTWGLNLTTLLFAPRPTTVLISKKSEVRVHGLDYVVDNVEADHELLIVDDVFDSGRSIRAIIEKLRLRCRRNMPEKVKVACPWFKPRRNVTDIKPDFYMHATDKWLVFPHELQGLTLKEIAEGKGPDIAETISRAMPDD